MFSSLEWVPGPRSHMYCNFCTFCKFCIFCAHCMLIQPQFHVWEAPMTPPRTSGQEQKFAPWNVPLPANSPWYVLQQMCKCVQEQIWNCSCAHMYMPCFAQDNFAPTLNKLYWLWKCINCNVKYVWIILQCMIFNVYECAICCVQCVFEICMRARPTHSSGGALEKNWGCQVHQVTRHFWSNQIQNFHSRHLRF